MALDFTAVSTRGPASRPCGEATMRLSGTIPLLDGETRYADGFRASMTVPRWQGALTFSYAIEALFERADPVPVG